MCEIYIVFGVKLTDECLSLEFLFIFQVTNGLYFLVLTICAPIWEEVRTRIDLSTSDKASRNSFCPIVN